MLATIFGVPQEDRNKLIHWSDTVERLGDPDYFETPEEDSKSYGNALNTLMLSGKIDRLIKIRAQILFRLW